MRIVKDLETLTAMSTEIDESSIGGYKVDLARAIKSQNYKLQGLALIQLGIKKRGFCVRDPKTKEFSYVFNPKVIHKIGVRLSFEGCLSSLPDRYVVLRPLFVKAEWYDEFNEHVVKWMGPKRARIFMHEFDHINGVIIEKKGLFVPHAYYVS